MKLAALMDYPDDARHHFTEDTMYAMMKRLRRAGVSRVYLQYYGTRENGLFWGHKAPTHREISEAGDLLPDYSSVFVEAAKKQGMETAVIMKPQEQGMWQTFSPYYAEARENPGIEYTGGKLMMTTDFVRDNPGMRIKRRSWDIDPDAISKRVCSIKLFKQNDVHTRIKKENIRIFVSDTNANYQEYTGDFSVGYSHTYADSDTLGSNFRRDYPVDIITKKGDRIEVITIDGLFIDERYIAVEVQCTGKAEERQAFTNVPVKEIAIFDCEGREICASPGHPSRFCPKDVPFLDAGFHFDDGFGEYFPETLDPDDGTGYIAICKGKDQYLHTSLCEWEPSVMEHWMQWQENAMNDGFDMVGNRIENHATHVDEPFAYGYNDCIKEEYFRRFGNCREEDMDLEKISEIRGDKYTELFKESARRARARGMKYVLTLNVEMLHKPIPIARHMAYPMNIQWQWKRWIDETEPDEINIRSYQMSPEFILKDPQCREILDHSAATGIPMTFERYCYWDFAEEFKLVRDTGMFESMTLYETNDIIRSDGKGGIIELKPELLEELERLTD